MKQEIIILLIGALIGFVSSIATLIVTDLIKATGKVKIYVKFVHQRETGKVAGFYPDKNNDMCLVIPLWIEILNNKKATRVVRNFNLILFNGKNEITEMHQINRNEQEYYYGDSGCYSFVIEPQVINHYNCQFVLHHKDVQEPFDNIKICYYDEKDKKQIFDLKYVENPWIRQDFKYNGIWKRIV